MAKWMFLESKESKITKSWSLNFVNSVRPHCPNQTTGFYVLADGHNEAEFGMSWCAGFGGSFYNAYFEVGLIHLFFQDGFFC